MRSLIVLALLAVAASALGVTPQGAVLTPSFVEALNSLPNMTWRASHNNGRRVSGADLAALRRLMSAPNNRNYNNNNNFLPRRVFTKEELQKELPASFDSAAHWPECKTIPVIYDQGQCSSCWAVAAASTASDRMCTTAGHRDLPLSTSNLMSCCYQCGQGCAGGGNSVSALQYWVASGFVSEKCQPYPVPPCEHHGAHGQYPPCGKHMYPTPKCIIGGCTNNNTNNNNSNTIYKGKKFYIVKGEEEFMREILLHGPIVAVFTAYVDFVSYRSGVYIHRGGKSVGVMDVRIVGWGVDERSGLKYWKVANSWNTDWGMKGYFLIRKGFDECGIELQGMSGIA